MTRRTRRPPFWRLLLLFGLIGVMLYINQVVVPATPPLFVPTPTTTRSPESFISQAQEAFSSGKITQAIQAYKDAINADPTNPSNYVTLARLQVFAGEYDAAIENAQNALLKNPEQPDWRMRSWAGRWASRKNMAKPKSRSKKPCRLTQTMPWRMLFMPRS